MVTRYFLIFLCAFSSICFGQRTKRSAANNVIINEYKAVLDRATADGDIKPSTSEQVIDNNTILALKNAGIWSNCDCLSKLKTDGGEGFALIDWKNTSNKFTKVGTPVFTQAIGVKSASGGYYNTNLNLASAVNSSRDDVSTFVYLLSNVNENSLPYGSDNGASFIYDNLAQSAGLRINRLNASTSGNQVLLDFSQGFFQMQRSGPTTQKAYYNSYIDFSNTTASVAPSNKNLYLTAYNENNTANYFSTRYVGFFGVCKALVGQEQALHAILSYAMFAAKDMGGISGQVNVHVYLGESGSNGAAANSDGLSAYEISIRPSVKIWQYDGVPGWQDLCIGGNNMIGNYPSGGPNHGWEVDLASQVEARTYNNVPTALLVKCGRGGSTIAMWKNGVVTGGINYRQSFQDKLDALINDLISRGMTPRLFIYYSQGINDMAASTSASTWQSDTESFFNYIWTRWDAYKPSGATHIPIVMTKFWSGPVDYTTYNSNMDAISSTYSDVRTVITNDLARRNNEHLNDAGIRICHQRMATVFKTNYSGL